MKPAAQRTGIYAALSSAIFLGMVPIFGKMAMNGGFSPYAVIAIRTTMAALLMACVMFFRMRPFFYIYPIGLIGCFLAGTINGLGSILYYSALSRLDAGIGHMLYSFYPLFVALWLLVDRQPITRITIFRLLLTIPAVILLILPGQNTVDLIGTLMMLGSAVLYALHMLINQRILFEAPAPTVTLYTLMAMAVTVNISFVLSGLSLPPVTWSWSPVLAMALITFFSRLTLFMGIKHLGGLQTALLGLAELLITIVMSQILLKEHLSILQWAGAAMLLASLVLVGFDRITPLKRSTAGWLAWLNPPQIPTRDAPWNSQF